MNNHYQLRGTLFVALSGLLFGFMGYFGTELVKENFSVTNMLFWRFFVATLWVACLALFSQNNFFKNIPDRMTLLRTFIIGAISYSACSELFFLASEYTGTGIAMVIFFCFPVFVTLFAWLTTTWQMNKYAALSLLAIILGLILLKGHGSHRLSVIGIVFAIFAGLSYAVYVMTSKQNTKNIDANLLTFLVCLGNAFIFFTLSYATHTLKVPTLLHTWLYVFAIGLIATALPIQLLLNGIKHISPIKASILSVLEPVVTLLAGVILLHESMSIIQSIGIIIVLLGALLIQFERQDD